jgi:hypothetical protein
MEAGTVGRPLTERWSLSDLSPQDVAKVRKLAVQRLAGWGYKSGDAALVVTELVTNVMRHADGRGVLYLQVCGKWLFVAASDRSPERPQVLEPDWESTSGRGVALIAALSLKWGVQPTVCGKLVWAFLPLVALPLCHRCSEPVDEDAGAIFICKELRRGQPDERRVYCLACSRRLLIQRIGGDDSGWGVTARCKTLVAS